MDLFVSLSPANLIPDSESRIESKEKVCHVNTTYVINA
jgi:hypothetical protein